MEGRSVGRFGSYAGCALIARRRVLSVSPRGNSTLGEASIKVCLFTRMDCRELRHIAAKILFWMVAWQNE